MLPAAFAPAFADGAEPARPPWVETGAGADVTSHVWLLYSSTTLAPFGDLYGNGLRLRASGGYGGYTYSGDRHAGQKSVHMSFDGTVGFGDALIGYLYRLDPLIVKVFGGVSVISHDVEPFDPENIVQGTEWGPKAVVELWLNMGATAWGSLDLNWTSAHETYAARLRTGYRVLPTLSVGVEAGVNGNALHDDGRGGLFLRYEWASGELSVSGGISGDMAEPTNPYVTVNWLTRF